MANSADCFVVLPPISKDLIFGRNSLQPEGEVREVLYIPPSGQQNEKCDGGAEIENISSYGIVIQRTVGNWGSESGANEKNVCLSVVWSDGEPNNENSLKSTDIVRLTLESSENSADAIAKITSLITEYGHENSKFSFILCDLNDIWLISTGGKLWSAEHITEGYRRIPSNGLAVTTKIDKSIENLGDKLKDLNLWDGSGDLNFAKAFSALPNIENWPTGEEPNCEGNFDLRNMLATLRSTSTDLVKSSNVTVLNTGISCHWFTVTQNPCESVYKPFVFAPNPKCSPLTKLPSSDEKTTLLHKLHSQRNWEMVGDLLKSLESTCIDEVNQFLDQNPEPNQELDELMKDCVEAEVKFYR